MYRSRDYPTTAYVYKQRQLRLRRTCLVYPLFASIQRSCHNRYDVYYKATLAEASNQFFSIVNDRSTQRTLALVDMILSSRFRLTVDPRTLKPRIHVRSSLQEPVELPTYRRHHTTYNPPKYRRRVVLTSSDCSTFKGGSPVLLVWRKVTKNHRAERPRSRTTNPTMRHCRSNKSD